MVPLKLFKKVINNNDVKPFFEFFLPEKNVIKYNFFNTERWY